MNLNDKDYVLIFLSYSVVNMNKQKFWQNAAAL